MSVTQPSARLFAAIWLPQQVVVDLQDFLSGQPNRPDSSTPIRPTRPDTWHITLAFLGDVPLEPALQRFASLVNLHRPAAQPVRLGGTGTFGAVCWIGVEHGPWLPDLARAAQRRLAVADTRFRAHVTVARARGSLALPAARAYAATLRDYRGPTWVPEEMLLVQSVLGPVPQYPVLARIAL